ncbi:MAG: ArsR/SmtB family transcription factor [Planctomycetota bacterium]
MAADRSNLLFKAFADETRLRILSVLRTGELCVGDLAKILRVPQPTASRHLAYLRRAGLVQARRTGLWHHYRLSEPLSALHGRLLDCLGHCFEDVKEIRTDQARATRVREAGGCCPQ